MVICYCYRRFMIYLDFRVISNDIKILIIYIRFNLLYNKYSIKIMRKHIYTKNVKFTYSILLHFITFSIHIKKLVIFFISIIQSNSTFDNIKQSVKVILLTSCIKLSFNFHKQHNDDDLSIHYYQLKMLK